MNNQMTPPMANANMGIATPPQSAGQPPPQAQPQRPGPQPLPPDLAQALALQEKQKMMQAAQQNMLMQQAAQQQAQGGLPTVVQALNQDVQQKEQQMAQMTQMRPPEAAPPMPQGVDALPSGLQGMAKGGIVGFNTGGGVLGDLPEEFAAGNSYESAISRAKEEDPDVRNYKEGVGNAFGFLLSLPIEALKHIVSAPGYGLSQRKAAAAVLEKKAAETPQNQRGDNKYVPPPAVVAAAKQAPKPAAANPGITAALSQGARSMGGDPSNVEAPAAPVAPEVDELQALLMQRAKEDPDAVKEKQRQWVLENGGTKRRAQGLEALLASTQESHGKHSAAMEDRDSLGGWKNMGALMRGMAKSKGSTLDAVNSANDEMDSSNTARIKQSLANDKELAKMRYDVEAAHAAGDDAAVKEGMDAYKDAVRERTSALSNATQYAGVKVNDATRRDNNAANIIDRQQRAQQHMEVLREQIKQRQQAAATGNKTESALAKTRISETMKAVNGELVALINAASKGIMDDETKARVIELRQEVDGYKKMLGDAIPEFKGQAAPASDGWGAKIVKKN